MSFGLTCTIIDPAVSGNDPKTAQRLTLAKPVDAVVDVVAVATDVAASNTVFVVEILYELTVTVPAILTGCVPW